MSSKHVTRKTKFKGVPILGWDGKERRAPRIIPMLLWCPACWERHIDKGEFATKEHHTHACQNCGMTWRPAVVPTVGVKFLPGFKDVERQGFMIHGDKSSGTDQTSIWLTGGSL